MLGSAGIASRIRSLSRSRQRHYNAVLLILAEPQSTQARLKGVKSGARHDLYDHVDILGRARWRRARVCDPQRESRPTEEDHFIEQGLKPLRGQLEQLDAQAGTAAARRSPSNLTASPRTRASPSRRPSIRASCSASAGLF